MGLGRDILERDLDVHGFALTNLRTATLPSDAVRFDQLGAGLTFTDGLTKDISNVVHGDYITGKAGGNTWSGGLNSGDGLTIDASKHAVKGPMRFNASGWGFNAAPAAPTMVDIDLTQSFAQTDVTTDFFKIRGSTVTFTADESFNAADHVAYVSIGQPTFDGTAFNDDITPTGPVATVWIEGAPLVPGWDDKSSQYSLFVKGGDVWFGGNAFFQSNLLLTLIGTQTIQKYGSGDLNVLGLSGSLFLGTTGANQAIRIAGNGNVGVWVTPGSTNRFRVNAAATVTSAGSAVLDAIYIDPSTISVSGATNITTAAGFNLVTFAAPTYNGTPTITNAATVTILGAPSGTAPITNPYSFWVQAGTTKLTGTTIIQSLTGILKGTSGTVGTATVGVDFQGPLSAADTTITFPTATTIKVNQLSNKFIVQGTTDSMLTGAQFLGALSTGLLKNTTTTGVLSTATVNVDYQGVLTFSTGLTNASNTITADLSTGKAGGLTVTGGTAAGESLTLQSTTNGTKGRILNGSWFALDEVNQRILIGSQTAGVGAPLTISSVDGGGSLLAITLNRAGEQDVMKSGGIFVLGTSDGNNFGLYTANIQRIGIQSGGNLLFGNRNSNGSIAANNGMIFRYDLSPTAGASAVLDAFLYDTATATISGGTTIATATGFNLFVIKAPTYNGSVTISAPAATFTITGAPSGTATISNPLSFWNQAGAVRYDLTKTIASATSATLDAFLVAGSTITISGSTNITSTLGVNYVSIAAPTFSNASLAMTASATLAITGPPSAVGGMTITSPYAFWTQAGMVRFDPSRLIPSATSAVLDAFLVASTTVTASGSTAITTATGFNYAVFKAPAITTAGTVAITNSATLVVSGAPTAAGGVTITNPLSFWVQGGNEKHEVGGETIPAAGREYFDIAPVSTPTGGGITVNHLYTTRIRQQTFANSGSSNNVSSTVASLYIDGAPLFTGVWSTTFGAAAIYVAAGSTQLGGDLNLFQGSVSIFNVQSSIYSLSAVCTVYIPQPPRTIVSSANAQFDSFQLFGGSNNVVISGTTPITTSAGFNYFSVLPPNFTNATANIVADSATVYIGGPPTISGGGSITRAYSLWIDTGIIRYDGQISPGGGAAATNATIGGSGPTAAAASGWLKLNVDGNTRFVQLWA